MKTIFVEGPREPCTVQRRSCRDVPPLLVGTLAPSEDLVCRLLDSVLLKWQSRVDREHTCIAEVEWVNAGVEATGGHCAAAEEAGFTPAKVSREQWGQVGIYISRPYSSLQLLVSVVN